jgi:hypothetical protein
MADETPPADAADAPKAKSSGEFLRLYVVVMGLMAGFLGWLWWHNSAQADDYRNANDAAKTVFGSRPSGQPLPDRPATIRDLAVGVLKYLATSKEAGKAKDGTFIPVQTIQERATGANLKAQNFGLETITKNPSKRYDEISIQITFEPANLKDFATFLYNIEATSTIFRILDFTWDLKPEKENPIVPGSQPGHLIGRSHVKIGFRRPSASK